MPSLEPNSTSGTRLALLATKVSMWLRSGPEANEYQLGRPGLVSTDGVEVSTAPSLVSTIDELPTPNRALRTQVMRSLVLVWPGVVSRVWSSVLLALALVKS